MLYAVSELSLLLRSREEPAVLTPPIRGAVAALDPELAIFNFLVMEGLGGGVRGPPPLQTSPFSPVSSLQPGVQTPRWRAASNVA